MACFHHLLDLLKSFLGSVRKKDLQKEQGGPRACVGAPLSPQGPVESPALASPECHPMVLGEIHEDESIGEALVGSLDRCGMTACRHETVSGKSNLDGMFRGGNKGGEREGSRGTGEEQVWENRQKMG